MWHIVVSFTEALIGLGIVALVISYLPSIYGAFSRRGAGGTLEVRAGLPPSPAELLIRYRRIGWLDRMGEELFESWERWFAEIEESHTSQARSTSCARPIPDGAGSRPPAACSTRRPSPTPPSPSRTTPGRRPAAWWLPLPPAHRRLLRHPLRPRPRPDDPDLRHACGVRPAVRGARGGRRPAEADREQAWRDFAGWRVNYDAVLIQLCALVMAPPAVWSSDRPTGRAAASRSPAGRCSPASDAGPPDDQLERQSRVGHWAAAQKDSATPARPSRKGTSMSHTGGGPRWGRIRTRPQRNPATSPSDVPPDRDAGDGEGQHQVDDEEPAEVGAHDRDLADDHAGDRAADEPEGDARRTGRDGADCPSG